MVEITNPGLAQRGSTIVKSAGVANGTSTIHTVTAGKTFYLTYANAVVSLDAANVGGYGSLQCDTGGNGVFRDIAQLSIVTLTGATTMPSLGLPVTPALPMPFSSGTVFRVYSNRANIWTAASIMGWEE
jgi:hypothetical protein